jgi:hypothetical protein
MTKTKQTKQYEVQTVAAAEAVLADLSGKRYSAKSGHHGTTVECPLCAKSGLFPLTVSRIVIVIAPSITGDKAMRLGANLCCNFMATPDHERCDVSGCSRRWVGHIS